MKFLKKTFKGFLIFLGITLLAFFSLFVLLLLEINKLLGDIFSVFRKKNKKK